MTGEVASEQRRRGRILLVDDEPTLLRAYRKTLEHAGLQVVTAQDGQEASRLLAQQSFDVVVSDISMPGMSGVELLRLVRERDLDLPVILMTGSPAIDTATRAIQLGVLAYLVKPFDIGELVAGVERAINLYQLARTKREALEYLNHRSGWSGDRAGLELQFDRALQTLWMAYQPIVSWSQRRIVAFEALVRPTERALPDPVALIHAAEQLGRIHLLGRQLREIVAHEVSAAYEVPQVFVNLHGLDLTDDLLFSRDAPLTALAGRVVLEITERASLDDVKDLGAKIQRLRDLGFRIAIDDLGAGYSGLTMFAQLQPEIVKLDMSLVRDVDHDLTKRRLVRSMIDCSREMGVQVVCEGVETMAERDTLVELGADLLQGYLFARPGRPFPPVEFPAVLPAFSQPAART